MQLGKITVRNLARSCRTRAQMQQTLADVEFLRPWRLALERGEAIARSLIVLVQRQGLFVVGGGLRDLSLFDRKIAETRVRRRQRWIDFNRLLVIRLGVFKIRSTLPLMLLEMVGEIAEDAGAHAGTIRCEQLQPLLERLLRRFDATHLNERIGPCQMGQRMIGMLRNEGVQILQ